MARRGWGSIQKRGGKFYGRFRQEGTGAPTMRLLKRPDETACTNLKEAETALSRLREDFEEGRAAPKRAPMSFRDWCAAEYLPALVIRVAPSSLRSSGAHVERFAVWCEQNGLTKMDLVRRKHVDAFVQFLVTVDGCKPSYVSRMLRTLRSAWRDAKTRGLVVDAAVWDDVELRIGPDEDVPWVSPEKLVEFYANVNAAQRPLVELLGETGLRVGEALALRWGDVELGARPSVFVRHGKTASARRKVPLSQRAIAALNGLARGDEDSLVFEPRSLQGVRMAVRAACAKTELPLLRTHSLRHVYASHLAQAGVPASTIAKLLGHADGGVLVMKRYGRWMPVDAEVAAMDRMTAWRAGASPAHPATAETSPAARTTPGTPSVPAGRPSRATTVAGS